MVFTARTRRNRPSARPRRLFGGRRPGSGAGHLPDRARPAGRPPCGRGGLPHRPRRVLHLERRHPPRADHGWVERGHRHLGGAGVRHRAAPRGHLLHRKEGLRRLYGGDRAAQRRHLRTPRGRDPAAPADRHLGLLRGRGPGGAGRGDPRRRHRRRPTRARLPGRGGRRPLHLHRERERADRRRERAPQRGHRRWRAHRGAGGQGLVVQGHHHPRQRDLRQPPPGDLHRGGRAGAHRRQRDPPHPGNRPPVRHRHREPELREPGHHGPGQPLPPQPRGRLREYRRQERPGRGQHDGGWRGEPIRRRAHHLLEQHRPDHPEQPHPDGAGLRQRQDGHPRVFASGPEDQSDPQRHRGEHAGGLLDQRPARLPGHHPWEHRAGAERRLHRVQDAEASSSSTTSWRRTGGAIPT